MELGLSMSSPHMAVNLQGLGCTTRTAQMELSGAGCWLPSPPAGGVVDGVGAVDVLATHGIEPAGTSANQVGC